MITRVPFADSPPRASRPRVSTMHGVRPGASSRLWPNPPADGEGPRNKARAGTHEPSAKAARGTLNVVLVEDSALLRGMLIDVLTSMDKVAVVGEAEDQEGGLRMMELHRPDVVIVDLELAGGNGIELLSALRKDGQRYGNPSAVVFTNHGSAVLRRRCETLGINGFFDKSYQLDALIDFIQSERDARTH